MFSSRFCRKASCRRKQSSRAGSNLEEEEEEEDRRRGLVRCGKGKLAAAVQRKNCFAPPHPVMRHS